MERGRELRADYKLIARALTRKGNALVKLDRLEEAIGIYKKSLTEHRCVKLLVQPRRLDGMSPASVCVD